MVFVADDFASWLVGQVAEASRKWFTVWLLGTDQERALRRAATAAVQRTVNELRPESPEQAAQLAMVVNEVFCEVMPPRQITEGATMLQALQAGIAKQLAPLGDADLTGIGISSAELLGVSAATLSDKLTRHVVQEIVNRGARGGPLAPMVNRLDHDVTHHQGERIEGMLAELVAEFHQALARLNAIAPQSDELQAETHARASPLMRISLAESRPSYRSASGTILSAYQDQVRELAPLGGLRERDAELQELIEFCAGDEPYIWWQAPPWAGKTALMSTFATNPPEGVRVASFFVTGRLAGQNDSNAFTDAMLDQLSALIDEKPVPPTSLIARDAHRRRLIREAAFYARNAGERLVLVVDGLDEDISSHRGKDAPSIASLLPKICPHGLLVIVSGRQHPPIPADVAADHPLRSCRIRSLDPSPYSLDIERDARHELERLLARDSINRDIIGLITASGYGLTIPDLESLSGLPRDAITRLLGTVFGRTVRDNMDPANSDAGHAYVFAHETLRMQAIGTLGETQLIGYRHRIRAWAETFRQAGWPPDTPTFLLSGYTQILGNSAPEVRERFHLADDMRRHRRQRLRLFGDAAAIREILDTQRLLLEDSSPNLRMIAVLAIRRWQLMSNNEAIPATLPAAWVRLGEVQTAMALAFGVGGLPQDFALVELAKSLAQVGEDAQADQVARAILEPWCRAKGLAELGHALHRREPEQADALIEEAMQVARSIRRAPQRMQAFVALAAVLQDIDPVRRDEIISESEQYLQKTEQADFLQAALSVLIEGVAEIDAGEAEKIRVRSGFPPSQLFIIDRISQVSESARLRQMIEEARPSEVKGIIDSAERKILSLDNSVTRGIRLASLSRVIVDLEMWERAERAARLIAHPYYRARALSYLTFKLANVNREKSRSLALECADVAREWQPSIWLTEVLPGLIESCISAKAWDRAEPAMRSMVPNRVTAGFLELAGALAQARLWDDAERVAASIEGVSEQVTAKTVLVGSLGTSDAGRARQIAAEAERLCSTLETARSRDNGLSQLAGALAQARLWDDAERVAAVINQRWDSYYSDAIENLLSQLGDALTSEPKMGDTWHAIRNRARRVIAHGLAEAGFYPSMKAIGNIFPEEVPEIFDAIASILP